MSDKPPKPPIPDANKYNPSEFTANSTSNRKSLGSTDFDEMMWNKRHETPVTPDDTAEKEEERRKFFEDLGDGS